MVIAEFFRVRAVHITQESKSHNPLQVLFGFGWVTGITWLLGFVLPMCSYQRLKVPSYRCSPRPVSPSAKTPDSICRGLHCPERAPCLKQCVPSSV